MTKLYGIKNCDTIKKARKWLEENQIEYTFHDYRADGLDTNWLAEVEKELGWEQLLNKRGTTYRQLSDEQKESLIVELWQKIQELETSLETIKQKKSSPKNFLNGFSSSPS